MCMYNDIVNVHISCMICVILVELLEFHELCESNCCLNLFLRSNFRVSNVFWNQNFLVL